MPQTLSKTRFKLALECPTKVFYSLDDRYMNRKKDDELLEALARGGHQVGALAKLMFKAEDPDAAEVTATDPDAQVHETAALLERENVTIFEATIRHDSLLVRADVLLKRGQQLDLIEVKAKSWDWQVDSLIGLTTKANPLTPEWESYVFDVAFQERVIARAYPRLTIRPWLMLLDKTRRNSVRGLGLKFEIVGLGRQMAVEVAPDFLVAQLHVPLLIRVDAQEAVRRAQMFVRRKKGRPDIAFDSLIAAVDGAIQRDERLGPFVGTPCKSCEFYCAPGERSEEVRSGWGECIETNFRTALQPSREETVFGFYGQADILRHVEARRLLIRDLEESELNVRLAAGKISLTARQQMQWQELRYGDTEPFVQTAEVRQAIDGWTFPLHFIDFETAQPALPFYVGHRPYQQILFQFSHHMVTTAGAVQHATECLLTDGEESPSVDVVRHLQTALRNDGGTVLHWYPHERTVLGQIREEIQQTVPPDSVELLAFLESLGLEKDSHLRLFDLGRLVADQVFLAGTGGSSSMKKFLPAVLRYSAVVRHRYSQPIYGTPAMPSGNFKNQVWFVEHDGVVLDPYQLLSPLFGEHELDETLALLEENEGEVIANGAAAMIAYAKLQNPRMPTCEREKLRQQLLRYCELDTLAMVMVYEALREWTGASA
jgi:hypothetical protein